VDWSHESVEDVYANPDLIKNIYIWETSDSAKLRLLRLNANAAKIEIPSVPEDLQPLLVRLQAKSSSLSVGLRAWEIPDSSTDQRSSRMAGSHSSFAAIRYNDGWQFDKNIPAIVHTNCGQRPLSAAARRTTVKQTDPVNWIVVVLNLDYIQKRSSPTLRNDTSWSGRTQYKLAVLIRGEHLA